MSDTLALASRLRQLPGERLAEVVREREIRPSAIKDVFDLAEALLDRSSIQGALTHLDRTTLAILAVLSERSGQPMTPADLVESLGEGWMERPSGSVEERLAVVDRLLLGVWSEGGATVYSAVAEQLRSWPAFGLPGVDDLLEGSPQGVLGPVVETDPRFIDRVASELAFAATSEVAELLLELERDPARELAKGGIALPDMKRLAHVMSVDFDSVSRLLQIAADAGLVARESGHWLITDRGGEWLLTPTSARWQALAAGWLARISSDVRGLLSQRPRAPWGPGLGRLVQWLYPAGGEALEKRAASHARAAELLGITANQTASGPGMVLLRDGPDAAGDAMASLLPSEVEKVYLQHDLSIVAPGPLRPEIDYRLRALADVESRALASSYRVSTASMNRAMAAGETADSVRAFLREVSLTGIPQPLDYLVGEASSRYGLLRAGDLPSGPHDPSLRSYLRSDDEALLAAVLVDQNLSALGFVQLEATKLASRQFRDMLFWVVNDARYPVAAENQSGEIVGLRRRHHARVLPASGPDQVESLVERLRLEAEAEASEPGEAWMARQLDNAIRSKTALTVSVTMPDGGIVEYELEPTSVAGGRLRGRDRRAAIERTLPLARVTGIVPADSV